MACGLPLLLLFLGANAWLTIALPPAGAWPRHVKPRWIQSKEKKAKHPLRFREFPHLVPENAHSHNYSASESGTPGDESPRAFTFDVQCDHGILDSKNWACCDASCGVCGGEGCSQRPGGPNKCCTTHIKQTCREAPPPCIMRTSFNDPNWGSV